MSILRLRWASRTRRATSIRTGVFVGEKTVLNDGASAKVVRPCPAVDTAPGCGSVEPSGCGRASREYQSQAFHRCRGQRNCEETSK